MPTGMPASGPGGTRRFWVTVLCFALANLGAWIAYDRFASRRHAHLEVRQAGPAEGSVVNGSTRLWWTFNLDVIPNSPGSTPPGLLSPAVPGKWHWDDPRTLSFVPDRPLPKATPITVTLFPDRLRTPDGFSLAAPHVMHFRTPALSLVNVRQQAFDEQDRLVLELEFDDDVLPSEVLAHLTLKSSEGKPVQFHQHSDASGRFVRVMTDPLPTIQKDNSQAYVKVCLSPGLGGRRGPLGLDQPFERNVTIASELMALDATARFDSPAEATLQVHFNNRVETQALRPLISVEPAVPFTLSQEYNGLALRGAFQPATRYAIRIAAAPKGTPRLKRPRPTTLSVYIPDREPGVWFEHEEGYLGSPATAHSWPMRST